MEFRNTGCVLAWSRIMARLNIWNRLSRWFSTATISSREEWYMDRAAECMEHAQRMTSKSKSSNLKVYKLQCEYLAEQLETAIKNSRESFNRSFSVEHKAECLGTLKVLYRVAKEVESFIENCCSDAAWMQAVLTFGSVPVRVCSWECDLKLCSKLLRNSNKLGAAWLTCSQVEGVGEDELAALKEMAGDDEDALRRSLESVTTVRSYWKSIDMKRDIELRTILLKRLKANSWGDLTRSSYLEACKVDRGGLRRAQQIGRGSSGVVWKAEWFGAMKVAEKKFDGSENQVSMRELRLRVDLFHPNIVSFLGYNTTKTYCSFFLELMDGDLRTLMLQRMQEDSALEAPFSICVACDIMLQVAEGVQYMHRNGVVHRDLKSTSILVRSSKGTDAEHVCAKVSNMALAKRNEKSVTYSSQTYNTGTTRWMAPELINMSGQKDVLETSTSGGVLKHPFKSDVYSFGMLCYEILTGSVPFENISSRKEVKEEALKGGRPELPSQLCPQSLKNLIELCWDQEPGARPSFAEICDELRYIRCSLLLDPLDQDNTRQPALFVPEALNMPGEISRFRGEYFALKVVRQLGKGGSDIVSVYLSTWLQPDNRVAQKRFNGSHNQCFVNEVSIMADLEHPNVVRLLYYATDRRSCSIVMELMDEDLYNLMYRRRLEGNESPTGPFSVSEAIDVILQIARGMEYVHGKNVVHRDLKSCNILVRKRTVEGELEVKVADFGLSMKLKSRSSILEKDSSVGTVRWMAPEVLDDTHFLQYDPFKSDVFSFGMVCYEILVGRVPFLTWRI